MKKLLLLLLSVGFVITANAQIHKAYLNENGGSVDSAHASFYILYNEISDTVWVMKLYKMNDTIIQIGTYKDKNLSIPNGKFVYYRKISTKGLTIKKGKIDTLNHINLIGYFDNGVKTGAWITYFPSGKIACLNTYSNNKLNGPYESYNDDTNLPLIKGNYVDDKREGDWNMLDSHGNIIEVDIYKNNQIIEIKRMAVSFVGPVPPPNFNDFILHSINRLIDSHLNTNILIGFTITVEGKLTNPSIIYGQINPETDKKLIDILNNSPIWKPAYNKISKQNLQDNIVAITIKSINGNLTIKYLGNDVASGSFTN